MSDLGLPDFGGQDLGIDLDKGIFVRKGKKSDNDSNDSGNNSMNTNGSGKKRQQVRLPNLPAYLGIHFALFYNDIFTVGSSNSSHSNPRDQNGREERLETHLEAERSEDENEFIDEDFKGKDTDSKEMRQQMMNFKTSSVLP